MKFGFVTSVKLGKSCMEAIYEIGGKLDLVITLSDDIGVNKSGRVFLDEFSLKHQIPLLKSSNINNSECVRAIREAELDWLFIIGWSQIANKDVLSAPKHGVLGIHPTLLPEGRGRAAIPWAILKGLEKTGVTMFKLDEGVDTGKIAGQLVLPLEKDENAHTLYEKVNSAHIDLIKSIFNKLADGSIEFREQEHSLATVWPGRKPADGEINLSGSVYEAERLIRAVTKPYPGAFYFNETGQKIIAWSASVNTRRLGTDLALHFSDGVLYIQEYELC